MVCYLITEGNPAICNNMVGPWGHYAKGIKSHRERQILYDITYIWNQINLTENKLVVVRGGMGDKRG